MSDGTDLQWNMMDEEMGWIWEKDELCIIANTIYNDKKAGGKGLKDVWNAFRCDRLGQVICQEKP